MAYDMDTNQSIPEQEKDRGRGRPDVSFSCSSFGISDAGKAREHNEDSMLDEPDMGLWVVADGMGGHQKGEIASQMIVESLNRVDTGVPLDRLIDDVEDELIGINAALLDKARKSKERQTIGSTVVGMLAYDKFCVFFWAGDSRLYRLRERALRQLTTDHSQVELYIERGLISRREAAFLPQNNMIVRAVGATPRLCLDFDIQEICAPERYMLCSDGLNKHVDDMKIQEVLGREKNAESACRTLVKLALDGGGLDNVTVIVIDFE